MNLPNYFFADLPREASLTPALLSESAETLRRNRRNYLTGRTTESRIQLLASVAAEWLRPKNQFRVMALEQGPAALGFSQQTLSVGLDRFFRQVTRENLERLVVQDLGAPTRLERITSMPVEEAQERAAKVCPPELLFHITAGTLPPPALQSILLGALLGASQFVKCATGASLLPRLFAHSLYQADRKLGSCIEVAEWPGGNVPLEQVLFTAADCITATGDDKTLASIRARIPIGKRFVAYGTRTSFAFVASASLTHAGAARLAHEVAKDVAAWDQLGCLSPHVIYVQTGGAVSPEEFAEWLADQLADLEQHEPKVSHSIEVAAEIASRRSIYEVRAAHSRETRMWCSKNSTAWTVIYEAEPRFQISCGHRFVYVKGVRDLAQALRAAEDVRGKVSTIGLAGPPDKIEELVLELAQWGALRICPIGQMQDPPLLWRHDGRPCLGELVTWVDWERGVNSPPSTGSEAGFGA